MKEKVSLHNDMFGQRLLKFVREFINLLSNT